MTGIILAAGGGSRLLPLTATMPKCLVAAGGRPILDQQLDALAAAGVAGAVVVGGYRIGQIAEHLRVRPPAVPTALVANPFWAIASSIGSVWAARAHLDAPFVLMNGDTVFDPAIVAGALARAGAGVSLTVEAIARPEPDDMLVRVDGGQVRDVAKSLDPAAATHRSLGLIVSAGGTAYRDALDAVIAEDAGPQAFHHAIVARLAATAGVAAHVVDRALHWQEIDRPEDLARWDGEAPAR